jgi:hypothetical protein
LRTCIHRGECVCVRVVSVCVVLCHSQKKVLRVRHICICMLLLDSILIEQETLLLKGGRI